MKTNYFTKIENKYVFNLSLIFWHLFIALSTIAIAVSLLIFLWSVIPPSERKVKKQPYPEKQQYPAPVAVTLNELITEDENQTEVPPIVEESHQTDTEQLTEQVNENLEGKETYDASIKTLETLIPPSKYSWSGSGYWTYPYGERYWTYYKEERFRHWNTTEASVEEKLGKAYNVSKASTYNEKQRLLESYIGVLKALPEEYRLTGLNHMLNNCSSNFTQNVNVCQSMSKVVSKMANESNMDYLYLLSNFGERNPNDGAPFIEYISSIIDKFDVQQRTETIQYLMISYYNYFDQDLPKLKESTDLFTPMLSGINGEDHSETLMNYYRLYIDKNRERDNEIAEIDYEYDQMIDNIENQYLQDQTMASVEYAKKKDVKSTLRFKSVAGIGVGILLIVLTGILLVFLSIQRSVRKIEEKVLAGQD